MDAPAAYEALADRFPAIEDEPMHRYLRSRSLQRLIEGFPKGSRLIEIGCGTGAEAAVVAQARGASVHACEPAPALARAAAKAGEGRVTVVEETAARFLDGLETASYDGLWSSFALGYEAPLKTLASALARPLRCGAVMQLTLRNPWCLAEPWRPIARTISSGHKVAGQRVPLHHASARAAGRALRPWFKQTHVEALPVLLPPPRLARHLFRRGLPPLWQRLDQAVAVRWPFRLLGDHTLLRFRRTPVPL